MLLLRVQLLLMRQGQVPHRQEVGLVGTPSIMLLLDGDHHHGHAPSENDGRHHTVGNAAAIATSAAVGKILGICHEAQILFQGCRGCVP